jgi:predicted DNA-binding transcriptional regulator YafY
MLLLQVHRRMRAGELAKRLEVSERTIHRDMEALSAAGIPVVAERGTGGGWRLLEEYRTNLTGLNEAEIQALFVTKPSRLLADLGWDKASEAGLIKLLAALPSVQHRDAEYARQRILVDTAGWHATEENIAFLPVLQEAIWQERRLYLTYRRGDGNVERLVDPLGLVAKGSIWYLVAAVDGEARTYRVSRVLAARISDEPCARPENFDLAEFWAKSSSQFVSNLPRYPVVIRALPELEQRIRAVGRFVQIEQINPPDDEGRITMHLVFQTEEMACGYLLSFGPKVEILEPLELREKVLELARNVLESYSQTIIP